MLLELKVSQFAIINNLSLTFKPGFNILSGETGAGKSVVLKSLALLMGEKAESDTVRHGADQATIEGLFDLTQRPDVRSRLNESGVNTEEDVLIVRRVITAQGKSKVYLNGSLSALGSLRSIVSPLISLTGGNAAAESDSGAPLIEMTGQHDNRHLLSKSYHLELLDHYAGTAVSRQAYGRLYERWLDLAKEIETLENESRTRAQRLDFLIYQRDEIRNLNLVAGEEEQLENHILRLRSGAKLIDFVNVAQAALYEDEDSVNSRLHELLARAGELQKADPALTERLANLQQARTLIEEAHYDLREYGRELMIDPEELNTMEERLSSIRRLQKKFGGTVAEILDELARMEKEIESLESMDSNLQHLHEERTQLEKELWAVANDLHTRRSNGAVLLARTVNDELGDLNMKGVQFGVSLAKLDVLGASGISEIEFTIRVSKKDEPRPLAKSASGGELSRILLALKRVVGQSDLPRTYLFDEVDAGVSGETAEKVGRKLKAIAQGQQVICVTHLPQVAAYGDAHFYIEKTPVKGGSVELKVQELKKQERVRELARLISGEKITASSLDHARQLLER
jgi:DNA repair protein RecN (Recombination protein N)